MNLATVRLGRRALTVLVLLVFGSGVLGVLVAGVSRSSAQEGEGVPEARGPVGELLDGAEPVPALSTETSRTYRRDDGTYISRVFAQAPTFKDANGEEREVDNTLRPVEGGYETAADRWTTFFPTSLTNAVRVRRGSAWASTELRGASGTGDPDGETITYAGALPDADVEYRVSSGAIGEEIHLRGPDAPSRFVFDLRAADGVTAEKQANGTIALEDADGDKVLALAPSYAFADRDRTATKKVSTDLDETSDGWRVTLTVNDEAWLRDALRDGPVTIDPTVALQGATKDCALSSDTPATSYCSDNQLWVGWSGDHDHHSLIRWDLSAIPADAVTLWGDVGLYQPSAWGINKSKQLTLHRLTRSWTNGASWNTYDGTHSWSTPGGDFDATPAATATVPAHHGGWTDWSITGLAQRWVDGSLPNYGIAIQDKAGPLVVGEEDYFSTEGTTASQAPELDIVWIPRTGVPASSTFETQALDPKTSASVNVANGNLVLDTNDLAVPGTGLDLRLDHYHNSLASSTELQGIGIRGTASLGRDLHLNVFDTNTVAFYRGDGLALPFLDPQTSGTTTTYTSPADLATATLTKSTTTSKYTLRLPGGLPTYPGADLTLTFSSAGKLESFKDQVGHTIAFSYYSDGGTDIPALNGITDTNGATYDVQRNYAGDGYIQDIFDTAGHDWNFLYGHLNTDYLTRYTAGDGSISRYAYDSRNRLKSITTPDGNVTLATYSGTTSKVASIIRTTNAAHTTGPTTTFTYSSPTTPCATANFDYAKTVVNRSDGTSTTYCANNHAQITYDTDPPAGSPFGAWYDLRDHYTNGTGTQSITLAGADAGSGVKKLALEQVGGAELAASTLPCNPRNTTSPAACPHTTTATLSFDPSAIAEGQRAFRQITKDFAGNVTSSASWTVKIDRTPPPAPTALAVDGYTPASSTAHLTWSAGSDLSLADGTAGSGLDHAELRARIGSGSWSAWATTPSTGAYDLTGVSAGQEISVEARALDAVDNVSNTATLTTVVAGDPPVNTALPTTSGTARDGETLTATTGTWSGSAPITYSRQWRRCDASGGSCTAISGATGNTYNMTAADVGATVRVAVTATNAVASVTAISAATGTVTANAPSNTTAPTISGAARDGETLTAAAGAWTGTAPIAYTRQWRRCDADGAACADIDGATGPSYLLAAADVGHRLRVVVTASNAAGSETATSAPSAVVQALGGAPEATPLPPGEVAPIAETTKFLYTGDDAIQHGVAKGTIAADRGAVVRGTVRDRLGHPVASATIAVVGHPEYGTTATVADGQFYMAVNGGERLTVRIAHDGYLPVDRTVDVPWADYAFADDATLVALDDQVTDVEFGSPLAPLQVAQGDPVTDADGTRRATLMFQPGTDATLVLPDGTTTPLVGGGHVRATEFTVGTSGESAMPAPLPPQSGYTYAAEFSLDEAIAAGADEVRFSRPVISYTDNFIGFDVGSAVPAGYYDREQARWVAADNGVVVAIVGEDDGLAELDVDGSGNAATPAQLDALDISDAERERLAALYEPGDELWRVALDHFTPWDFNWPYGPPDGASGPSGTSTEHGPIDDCAVCHGSIIESENQVLGEEAGLIGVPQKLAYRSDRAPGYKDAYTRTIPLTNADTPSNVSRVDLTIDVAGTRIHKSFDPAPDLSYRFTWDGKDSFGRTVDGGVPITTDVSYVYAVSRYEEPAAFARSFAQPGGQLTSDRSRGEVGLGRSATRTIGTSTARPSDLGGWTLDDHHFYDASSRTLQLGDGTRRSADGIGVAGKLLAGDGLPDDTPQNSRGTAHRDADGDEEDDEDPPAFTAHDLVRPIAMAPEPDGSVLVVEDAHSRLLRVSPSGAITVLVDEPDQDISDVTVAPNGSILLSDDFYSRIRRLEPDGTLTTIAGVGDPGSTLGDGDDGPAADAHVGRPNALAVAPDGSIYFADRWNNVIRRITPDGTIERVAGVSGATGNGGDGGPARAAELDEVVDLAVAPDGALLALDGNAQRLRRIAPDGTITTIAGSGETGYGTGTFAGDGGPATEARLSNPGGVAVDGDGIIYIADTWNSRVRRIDDRGIIATIAGGRPVAWGNSTAFDSGTGGQVPFTSVAAIVVRADGDLAVSDTYFGAVFRLGTALPGFTAGTVVIPSEDGHDLYTFGNGGRHLSTRSALTGAELEQFAYDGDGRLTVVTDADGNATTIERSGDGKPTAIVGPYGQRTELTLDASGRLTELESPAGEATTFTYGSGGLLTSMKDNADVGSTFSYDDNGRLVGDANAKGSGTTLVRAPVGSDGGRSVALSDPLNGTATSSVEYLESGTRKRVSADAAGLEETDLERTDGTVESTDSDGMVVEARAGGDPQFGAQVPLSAETVVRTPSGNHERTAKIEREVEATGTELHHMVQSETVNGHTSTSEYEGDTRTLVETSAEGRKVTTVLDARGREVSFQDGDSPAITTTYDVRGRVATRTQDGKVSHYAYDAHGNLAQWTGPDDRSWSWEHDAANRIVEETNPAGATTHYRYDDAGQLIGVTPAGKAEHVLGYDTVGGGTRHAVPGTPDAIENEYDDAGRLTRITRPGSGITELDYDDAGRLSESAEPGRVTTFGYDPDHGQVRSIVADDGERVDYTWDGALLTHQSATGAADASISYTYDDDLRLASTTVAGSAPVAFSYDADDVLTGAGALTFDHDPDTGEVTASHVGDVTTAFAYDADGSTASITTTSPTGPVLRQTETRDDAGRTTAVHEEVAGTAHDYAYTYDDAGRLHAVTRDGDPWASYAFDANGNRTSADDPSDGARTATYDSADRLLTAGDRSFAYDGVGQLASETSTSGPAVDYDYDAAGDLVAVRRAGDLDVTYTIDALDRPVARARGGDVTARWVWSAEQDGPLAELDDDGDLRSRFVYGTAAWVPDYMVRGGNTYRIVRDRSDNVRAVVDVATGAVTQRLAYDPFGRVLEDTNPGFQPFGYAGGLYDHDTGLTLFGARWYEASIGRWTSSDPASYQGGDTNLYAYALGDPVNGIDPSGLGWLKKHLGFSIDDISNCVAGFGDNVSYGLTGAARRVVGGNEVVDRSSKCYKAGDLVGEVYPTKRVGQALKVGSKVCKFAKKAGRGGRKGGRGGGEDRMKGSNRRWNKQIRDAAREGGLTGKAARDWRKQKEAEKREEGMGGADNYDDYQDLVDDARGFGQQLKRNRPDDDADQWGRRDDMP
jgi:RHS repeat-associated protein